MAKDVGMVKRLEVEDVVIRVLLALLALAILLPLIWVFYTSLKTNQEFFLSAWKMPKVLQWKTTIVLGHNWGLGRAF